MTSVKLFVAAYTPLQAIVVFFDSEEVLGDIEELGGAAVLVGEALEAPSDGLWMFEGHRITSAGGVPRYRGEWRRPTDAEAIAAAAGENPCFTPCGAPEATS